MNGLQIESVIPLSIADEMDVVAGDRLLAINGQRLRDIIDYSYYTASEELLLLDIQKLDGELWELEIERNPSESLGLIFSAPTPSHCANNCLFCFVHQLPKGLRKPLYIKDEDYRLSFLNGNYVTLANITDDELNRIVEQRLSPLYISVHTINPELREHLLGKSGIPPILRQLQKLAEFRITLHTQIVLCPGINDGDELLRTVTELANLYPAVQSIAVVPLGMTNHRKGLPELQGVDAEYANNFILTWQPLAEKLRKKLKHPFLFLADEFYIKANRTFPAIKEYGDFPQIENGIGMMPLFLKEAERLLKRVRPMKPVRATVITGVSAFGFISDFISKLNKACGIDILAVAIENKLFGSNITVTGLISGKDILATLSGVDTGSYLLIPDVTLKEGEGVFLDDITTSDLAYQSGCQVIVFDSTPAGFYKALRTIGKK